MNEAEVQALAEAMAKQWISPMAQTIAELRKRVDVLEREKASMKWVGAAIKRGLNVYTDVIFLPAVKRLKAGRMEYQGIYDRARSYKRGAVVSKDGCMWHCEVEETMDVPGRSDDWQMCVKSGQDRDRRPGHGPNHVVQAR